MKTLITLLFLCSCYVEPEIKKQEPPKTQRAQKKKDLDIKIPDIWKECSVLKAEAKSLASVCWEEIADSCVLGEERKTGECPTCDALDRVNEKMIQKDCFLSKEDMQEIKK